MPAAAPTAVRSLGRRTDEGWTLLTDVGSSYRDGAEDALYELVMAADESELGSTDDVLLSRATGWAEQYHVHPARANVVRPLAIPEGARVLEIGAGCGAVTRYLGESAALVDALEPVPSRARVAHARTRDLASVEVFVGALADVPAEQQYDVVVVVGVLEYVGGGSADAAPYRQFLDQIAERLVPGGTLVLAIENKLGVKYVAGAPEDHTGRYFDSLESYPYGSPARTFSRRELEQLARDAGLTPQTLVAFPDYKLTRTVLDVEALAGTTYAELLHAVPSFPSPDTTVARPRLSDEGSLWRTFIDAGLATETGNSFVLLARSGEPAAEVWPADQAGAFYSTGRRAAFATETRLRTSGDGLEFVRRTLRDPAEHTGEVALHASSETFITGTGFYDLVAVDPAVDGLAPLLEEWQRTLRERIAEDAPVPVDLVPHNLRRDGEGRLVHFDQEWTMAHASEQDVLARGVLWLSIGLSQRFSPVRLGITGTIGDIARRIGPMVGLDEVGHWISPAVEWEARFQSQVQQGPADETEEQAVDRHRQNMLVTLGTPLERTPFGEREPELRQRAEATVVHLTTVLERTQAEADRFRRAASDAEATAAALDHTVQVLQTELTSIRNHPVVRVARKASRVAGKVAPEGSVLRRAYRKAKRELAQARRGRSA